MQAKRFKGAEGPEAPIKRAVKALLEHHGWFVKVTHGSQFQSGLPDLYCCHKAHGQRWIEIKNPLAYHFTPAQEKDFREFTNRHVGIWILVAATQEEYNKLFQPPNWGVYIGHSRKPY